MGDERRWDGRRKREREREGREVVEIEKDDYQFISLLIYYYYDLFTILFTYLSSHVYLPIYL